MVSEKPETPFVMSLIGGIFVLVDGALGFMFAVRFGNWPMWIWNFQNSEYVLGPSGIILGIVIIVAATLAYKNPRQNMIWGPIIVIASLLSFFLILGGYIVGFIFGLVGGILFLVWEPAKSKRCVRCGRQIGLESVFCPYCGLCYAPGLFYYPGQQAQAGVTAQQAPGADQPGDAQQASPYQQSDRRVCRKCGSLIFEGATFCSNCGERA